ncbi:MAG: hypothetical protein E4G90_10895 [Gemmatimonadales bacterium]|nr:MAG: hypothetical protein E4G90_10895 [Gemmatimonadales bacterium]
MEFAPAEGGPAKSFRKGGTHDVQPFIFRPYTPLPGVRNHEECIGLMEKPHAASCLEGGLHFTGETRDVPKGLIRQRHLRSRYHLMVRQEAIGRGEEAALLIIWRLRPPPYPTVSEEANSYLLIQSVPAIREWGS